MRVLHISKYYFPFIGGIEQVARDCVSALGSDGYEQKVFCFNHEKGDRTDTVDGTEVIRTGCFAKVASQSLSFSYGKLLRKTFREFSPDVVIFHYPNPFGAHFLKKLLKKYPACKLILWWHLDITRQKILGKLFERQTKWLLRRADRVVATSPNYIEGSQHLRSVREKCTVISCCVSDELIRSDDAAQARAQAIKAEHVDQIICFALGRHVPYKGMEYLIKAAKLLDERFFVAIGGSGPLTEQLKAHAQGQQNIKFLGRLTDEERKEWLLACDIFCFPSVTKNEAYGISLAEAMAFEKPAVTFTIPGSGVNYVSLDKVTGIECPNGDVEAFAQALRKLASDTSFRVRCGKAAGERVREHFTYERFAENVRRVLAEL